MCSPDEKYSQNRGKHPHTEVEDRQWQDDADSNKTSSIEMSRPQIRLPKAHSPDSTEMILASSRENDQEHANGKGSTELQSNNQKNLAPYEYLRTYGEHKVRHHNEDGTSVFDHFFIGGFTCAG